MYSLLQMVPAFFAVLMGSGPDRSPGAMAAIVPSRTTYAYDGIVYDRLFFAMSRSKVPRAATRFRRVSRTPAVAGAPYRLTDLSAETGLDVGAALAVNVAGDIAYWFDDDPYFLLGDPELVHDDGTYEELGQPPVDQYGDAGSVPYALNSASDVVGVATIDCCTEHHYHTDWVTKAMKAFYIGYGFDDSFAYAVNASNVSVGQAVFAGGPAAAVFSISPQGGDRHPVMLPPPKGTSWIGTATGINDAGEIVGYARERAVVFHENAYAQVLPVGAAGVSTSAQAINAHGDIVGNAGSAAFLYRYNRVTYLPRPPGEEAGNAVAVGINAAGEIVGNIIDPVTGASTAFLYVNGRSYDLTSLLPTDSDWHVTAATGINDKGEIVGAAASATTASAVSLKPTSALQGRSTFTRF